MLRNAVAFLGCTVAIMACDGGDPEADPIGARPGSLDATKGNAPPISMPGDDVSGQGPKATERCEVRSNTQNVVVVNGRVVSNVSSSSCNGREVRGSGVLASQRRDLAVFTALEIEAGLSVEIERGAPALNLLLDDDLIAQVVSEIRDGTLTLRVRDEAAVLVPSEKARIVVSAPDLVRVETQDAASLRGTVSGRALTVRALGASTQDLSILSADTLQVDASGASQISVSSTVSSLNISASGAARVSGGDGVRVAVAASGAAQVRLRATQSVRAAASGTARVSVLGNPSDRDVRTEGVARVSFGE